VGGLALALATNALEDGRPYAVGVIEAPQSNIDQLDAILLAHLPNQAVGPFAKQRVLHAPHARFDSRIVGRDHVNEVFQRHLANYRSNPAADARAEDRLG